MIEEIKKKVKELNESLTEAADTLTKRMKK
jgi:uncharacterized protein YfkK (UPF0435 family)